MIQYTLKGGSIICATSAKDFLQKLHRLSQSSHKMPENEFLKQFANRVAMSEDYSVRTDNPGVFLADLLAHGFVTASR